MPATFLGKAAQWYGKRGYPIFPLHDVAGGRCSCGSASCDAPGKHPRISSWPQRATPAEPMIRAWWHRWPNANIALVTGAVSGLVVLDVDPRHGGESSLEDLQHRHGGLPSTVTARTGGGGWHYFFQHPGPRVSNSSGLLGPGLDVRGDGGYIVVPPSLHASGRFYTWEEGRHPQTCPLADLPDWLLGLLVQPTPASSDRAPRNPLRDIAMGEVTEGQRNTSLTRLAGYLLCRRVDPFVTLGLLRSWNQANCRPPLTEEEIRRTLDSIACSEARRRGVLHG